MYYFLELLKTYTGKYINFKYKSWDLFYDSCKTSRSILNKRCYKLPLCFTFPI